MFSCFFYKNSCLLNIFHERKTTEKGERGETNGRTDGGSSYPERLPTRKETGGAAGRPCIARRASQTTAFTANYGIQSGRSYCSSRTEGVSIKSPRVYLVGYILRSTYPENKPWLLWSYSGFYPGTPIVNTRVPSQYIPGYPHSTYSGILTVYTQVPREYIPGYTRVHLRVYTLLTLLNTPLKTSYLRKRRNLQVARVLLGYQDALVASQQEEPRFPSSPSANFAISSSVWSASWHVYSRLYI